MDFDQICSAVRATHDPFTPQEIRAQAFQLCEDLKSSFDVAFQVAVQMLNVENPDIFRHFGLHLLEHLTTAKWNLCSMEQREILKQTSLQLLESGSRDLQVEQLFVKHSIAKVILELAKREWPQRWPSLTESLVACASKKEVCLELVLFVIRDLAEATTEYSFTLPERRRMEIQQGLVACLPHLFPLLQSALASQLTSYQQNQGQVQAQGQPDQRKSAQLLVNASLRAIAAYVEWINDDFVFTTDLIAPVCSALSIPDLFQDTSLIVERMLRRSAESHQPLMLQLMTHTLQVTAMLLNAPPFEEQTLFLSRASEMLHAASKAHMNLMATNEEFRNQYFQVLLSLLQHPDLRVSTPSLLMWILILRSHAAALAPPPAGSVVAVVNIMPVAIRPMIVAEVFKAAGKQFAKTKDQARGSFESDDEFYAAFAAFRGNLTNLIRLLASSEPLPVLQYVAEQLIAASVMPPIAVTAETVAAGYYNQHGQLTMSHPQFLAYEAAGSLMESVLKAIPASAFQAQPEQQSSSSSSAAIAAEPNGISILSQLLQQLLSQNITESMLLTRQLHAIRLFVPLYEQNLDALKATLEKLFNSLTFSPPSELPLGQLPQSEDTRSARRRASHSLIGLSASVPQQLLNIFPDLVQQVIQLVNVPEITDADKTTLFQFLVTISNAMPDRSQQSGFIGQMTESMVADLLSEPVTAALSSFQNFVTAFGLFQPENTSRGDATVEFRIKVRSILLNFAGILRGIQATEEEKRSSDGGDADGMAEPDTEEPGSEGSASSASTSASSPSAVPLSDVSGAAKTQVMLIAGWPLIQQILPQVMQLVSILHSLHTSNARELTPVPLRAIYAPCREELMVLSETDKAIKEKTQSIGGVAVAAAASAGMPAPNVAAAVAAQSDAFKQHVTNCQSWLYSVRENCYSILAAATQTGAAFFQTYSPQMLVSSIFAHLDSQEARHLRLLFDKFITPMTANCPIEEYNRLLLPILQVIITTTFGRLSTGWLSATDDDDGENGDASVLESMIEDRMLRELTRSFCYFIANMCIPHAGYGFTGMTLSASLAQKSYRSSARQDMFCLFLLSNEGLFLPLFAALTGCLCWPDDTSARRAVGIIARFIPMAVDKPVFHPHFASILTAALRRLMPVRVEEADDSSLHNQLVGLIREIYFQFIQHSTMPREVLASLPNMDMQDLQNFEEHVTNIKSDKKSKQMCRSFLEKYVIGVGLPAKDKASALLDLPESLVLQSAKFKDSAPDWKEANLVGLQRLFS